MTSNSLTENGEHDNPLFFISLTNFEDHFWIACLKLFLRPQYVWFPEHLLGPVIPDPCGQLAELIVYIIPPG